jgi:ATP-dependent Clp protease ATP-binding subunit ClpC
MTSNIGASMISKNMPLGFAQSDEAGMTYEDMKSKITGELKRVFRPEFLNRVDEIIVFHKLDEVEIKRIVGLLIGRVNEHLKERQITVELTSAAEDLLGEKGFDPTLGARPLRRSIQRYIEDKLADAMLERQLGPGTVVHIDRRDDDTVLTVDGEEVAGAVDLSLVGMDEIALSSSSAGFSGPPVEADAPLAEVPGES